MVKGPEQMRCDHMWDACINQPRNRQKGEIAHAYCKQDTGKQQCLSQRSNKHCLWQRPEGTLSRRDRTTLSIAEGKQGNTKLLIPHHGTRDTIKSIRIRWTLKKPNAENRDTFQLTRNSLDTFHPRNKRCQVCRDFTAARCDHRATGYI